MSTYRRNDGGFSRVWRRSHSYTLQQLRHMARRHRAKLITHGDRCAVMDLRSGQQLASFAQEKAARPEEARVRQDETLQAYAALRL